MNSDYKSTHELVFYTAQWWATDEFMQFKVGTCHGLWKSTETSYDILAIDNHEPGNGHLQDVFDWFEFSCLRDSRDLRILELMNPRFIRHLINKRGFYWDGKIPVNLVKKSEDIKNSKLVNNGV